MASKYLGLPTYCIVTGASQGIGSKIAVELSRKFAKGSLMVLLARSVVGLDKTKDLISKANPDIVVYTHSVDLSKPNAEEYESIIDKSLRDSDFAASKFDLSSIVHNAGSVGDIKEYCADMSDPKKMEEYFSLNLFSVMCLTSVFLTIFPKDVVKNRLIINITSLCAVKPFKSLGYYCIGKASREMFFKVLAEEDNNLKVLSYSPGPVNTDMISHIMLDIRDPDTKDLFTTMKKSESILTTEQTVLRLINILEKGNFESGCRIDYFDSD
ncbi:hypothetical protein R5R35_004570 [Gryllus longicercus]|uniref:Sepiapterin reductase n=1 Tax=Gryllus longicercus TaxID=2509291 RepID=A0AAN9W634_9ORTH